MISVSAENDAPPTEKSKFPPKQFPTLLPTAPIGCLLDPLCNFTKQQNILESVNAHYVDLNSISRSKSYAFPQGLMIRNLRLDEDITLNDVYEEVETFFEMGLAEANDSNPTPPLCSSTKLSKRPEAYLDKALQYSDQIKQCKASFLAIQFAAKSNGYNEDTLKKILLALYYRYVEYCFHKSNPELIGRLALFISDGTGGTSGVYCLGFDLDGRHVVTAKHCVSDPNATAIATDQKKKGKVPAPIKLEALEGSKIVFANEFKIQYAFEVSKIHADVNSNSFSVLTHEDDIAVVELKTPRSTPLFPVGDLPSDWTEVRIFTTFVDPSLLGQCAQSARPEACALDSLVKTDESPYCSIAQIKDRCILHACQTRPGSSGGPIIAISGGKYFLVGVHTGSIDDPCHAPCGLTHGEIFPNYGLTVASSPVVKKILDQHRLDISN